MERLPKYAISVKQPWASLILAGQKTIEIRSWPTTRRGLVYIHAGRIVDKRTQGWDLIRDPNKKQYQITGGLLGTVELTECITYTSHADFARDQELHLNDPAWFDGTVLYGFRLAHPEYLPAIRPMSGWFRFFPVKPEKVGKA